MDTVIFLSKVGKNGVGAGVNIRRIYQGLLSALLAAALFLSSALPVSAEELTEPVETTAPVETTELPETVPAAQPGEVLETLPQTQPTEPAETVPETHPIETTEPTLPETQPVETTCLEEEPTLPETTEVPETTEPVEETGPKQEKPDVLTIAQAQAIPANTRSITIQGTVVYLSGTLAVLQDNTGGIRVTFEQDPGVNLGHILQVTGRRSGGIQVVEFKILGAGEPPAVDATLMNAPENLRVLIQNARVGKGSLNQNGFSLSMQAVLPEDVSEGSRVSAWGVILDGWFYADTIVPLDQSGTKPEDTTDWNPYFGLLHAHTDLSDGQGSVTDAFAHASSVEGLDFFAVTDHSNSFDNASSGDIHADGSAISEKWAQGKAAAAAVTGEGFVGIFGYEMTWPEMAGPGHINTFATRGWQTRDQEESDTLEEYFAILGNADGSISQFNHPSEFYGNFHNFSDYKPEYDAVMQLIEVGGEDGVTFYDLYTRALDWGWHLAPTNSQNNHNGGWGDISPARTVVLATELKEQSIYDAMRNHRVYATEDSDLSIIYRMNGHIMGSTVEVQDQMVITVSLKDPTDTAIGTVEVIADGGRSIASQEAEEPEMELTMTVSPGYGYYYLRITQPDGDIAVTAPVWVENYEDVGVRNLICEAERAVEGQEVLLSFEVYNDETVDFELKELELYADDQLKDQIFYPDPVKGLDSDTFTFSYTGEKPGQVKLVVKAIGTVAGLSRTRETSMYLRVQSKDIVPAENIRAARFGDFGTTYQVTGRLTADNSNYYNTFADTLYLQDDTAGIAVVGTVEEKFELGTWMEITGTLQEKGGNRILELTDYVPLEDKDPQRYLPQIVTGEAAMDYEINGGELMEVEGKVVSLSPTADKKGISRFTVQTGWGGLVTVMIEEEIRSGAHGVNELASKVKWGRNVHAIGLLHVDEYGKSVLRMRNCDEVVYVPARSDPSNPGTGDWFGEALAFLKRITG